MQATKIKPIKTGRSAFSLELRISFLLFCLFVILVAMATMYKQRYAKKIFHVKCVSISFHEMYGLLYLYCLSTILHNIRAPTNY